MLSPAERTPEYRSEDDYCEVCDYPQSQARIFEPEPDSNPYLDFPYPPRPFQLPKIEPELEESSLL